MPAILTPTSPGGGGEFDGVHNDLPGRAAAGAHPAGSITGLGAAALLDPAEVVGDPAAQAALSATFASARPRRLAPRLRGLEFITQFQSGHGWTITAPSGSSQNANDTSDFLLGSQSARLTTPGTDTNQQVNSPDLGEIDMSGKALVVWFKLSTPIEGSAITVYATHDSTFGSFYSWPVKTTSNLWFLPDRWAMVTLSFADAAVTGTPDRTKISRIRLRVDDDPGVPITCRFNGVATMDEPAEFPNGVVSITFDDGHASQFTRGRAILDRYGFPATLYAIADRVGESNFVTQAQLDQLATMHGWDIGGHAFAVDSHNATYPDLSPDERRADLDKLRTWLDQRGYGRNFAYPLGKYDAATVADVEERFASARTIFGAGSQHRETFPPADPMLLRSWSVSSGNSVATITGLIDKAIAEKRWLILVFHYLVDSSPSAETQYLASDFSAIVDYIASSGIAVRTVSEVMSTRTA